MFQRLKAPSGAWTTSLPLRCSRERSAVASQPHLPFRTQVRHATHGAASRANGPKNGPGKRLGAKKTGDEYVIPGNIIFRQRGTNWHPGTNCGRGRDHTIYALQEGYVKYYRDPKLHPKRRFIGVVFDRSDTLPLDPNAPRRRRLNMYAAPRSLEQEKEKEEEVEVASGAPSTLPSHRAPGFREGPKDGRQPPESLVLRSGYNYRESNYSIGRTAERAGVKVKLFKPGDRFLAWRKTAVRRRRRAMLQQMRRKKGSTRKGKQK